MCSALKCHACIQSFQAFLEDDMDTRSERSFLLNHELLEGVEICRYEGADRLIVI